MKTLGKRIGLFVCGSLAWMGLAVADAVVDWNLIASQAVATASAAIPPRPGPPTLLDFATVHAAVHDAVQAIEGRYEPYAIRIPGASGSAAAAVAKAAHDVLVNRFPSQAAGFLDPAYQNYLAANDLEEDDPGVAVGQQAAAGIIALRATDGSFPAVPPAPFTGGTDPGVWRPTPSFLASPPPSFAPMAATWLATVTPFTLKSPDQFRVHAQPALTSRRYARDYNEVKALGADVNSSRTDEQTALATFWNLNFIIQWQRALRDIAVAHVADIADNARLFALANMAMADAAITAWDSKVHYVFWRPITAIQEGDNDGNPETEGDPNWRPFINTPNYPDYTSGANGVTGAVTRILKLFFGTDKMSWVMTSNNPAAIPSTLTYERFSDAADDVVEVRILHGIHFRFADVAGRLQGRHVAGWAFHHFLRPVNGALADLDFPEDDEDD